MSRRRRGALITGAAVAAVGILALIAPPSASGLSALDRFLSASGVDVQRSGTPPTTAQGTFVLLIDRRTSKQEGQLLTWVESGGRLIVADPVSPFFVRYGVTTDRAGVFGTTTIGTGCVRPETLGVNEIQVGATDQVLTPSAPNASPCFAQGGAGYAQFLPVGRGEIVLLGGTSFLSDGLLNHADNAVFAYGVLNAGGPVVFGPASPPDAVPHSVWSLIPGKAKAVIWELAIAALLFAVARARRLGRPVPEATISPIPSGELVRATARLYHVAGARAFCATTLRRSMIERSARRLGLAPDPDHRRQSEAIVRRLETRDPAVQSMLDGPEPASDEAFVVLCRELERFADQIEGAEP
ncbi:MAG: hypothetical protein QOI81_1249, partial [Actinomycetota bacterium]|nr:hypothetical protein [Actinomycetota bacterium]